MSSQPYVGEIMMFGGNFAPAGWELCNGQILPIAQNTVLFALIGTTYGGDGITTFALPDLRGRMPLHMGQGGFFTNRILGSKGGTETETLTLAQIHEHGHNINAITINGNSKTPVGPTVPANVSGTNTNIYSAAPANATMAPNLLGDGGGGQPHNNLQSYLTINFCISLFGVFPSQN